MLIVLIGYGIAKFRGSESDDTSGVNGESDKLEDSNASKELEERERKRAERRRQKRS